MEDLERAADNFLLNVELEADKLRKGGAIVEVLTKITPPSDLQEGEIEGKLNELENNFDSGALPEIEYFQDEQEKEEETREPLPVASMGKRYTKKRKVLLAVLLCLFALSIGFATYVFYSLIFVPSATVSIKPDIERVTTISSVKLVKKPLETDEIQAILLPTKIVSQQEKVQATGTFHQFATQASGYVTFFNFLTTPQTVFAGTLLSGSDGQQVVTEEDAYIQAGTLGTNGESTVKAHAVNYGSQGNIKASDIYGECCRIGIQASNTQFYGGRNEVRYSVVTQQDYTYLVSILRQSVEDKTNTMYSSKGAGEGNVLVTPVPCREKILADHQPGNAATELTIVLTRTCTPIAYNSDSLQSAMLAVMNKDAKSKLSPAYSFFTQELTVSTPQEGNIVTIPFKVTSSWVFTVNEVQLKKLLAGKTKEKAMQLLHAQQGIRVQALELQCCLTNTLPTDVRNIHIISTGAIFS